MVLKVVMVTLTLVLASTEAGAEPEHPMLVNHEVLRGLTKVRVVFDAFLDSLLVEHGLVPDSVQGQVCDQLTNAGLQSIPESAQESDSTWQQIPRLYFLGHITEDHRWSSCSCQIDIDLREAVRPKRNPAICTDAATWYMRVAGNFRPCDRSRALREQIHSNVEIFIMWFQEANGTRSRMNLIR